MRHDPIELRAVDEAALDIRIDRLRPIGKVAIFVGPKAPEPQERPRFSAADLDRIEAAAETGCVIAIDPGVYVTTRHDPFKFTFKHGILNIGKLQLPVGNLMLERHDQQEPPLTTSASAAPPRPPCAPRKR